MASLHGKTKHGASRSSGNVPHRHETEKGACSPASLVSSLVLRLPCLIFVVMRRSCFLLCFVLLVASYVCTCFCLSFVRPFTAAALTDESVESVDDASEISSTTIGKFIQRFRQGLCCVVKRLVLRCVVFSCIVLSLVVLSYVVLSCVVLSCLVLP